MVAINWVYVRKDKWKGKHKEYTVYKKLIGNRELYEVWYNDELQLENALGYFDFMKRIDALTAPSGWNTAISKYLRSSSDKHLISLVNK